jgi:hypothetical protein
MLRRGGLPACRRAWFCPATITGLWYRLVLSFEMLPTLAWLSPKRPAQHGKALSVSTYLFY